jgi:ATP-dependent RNA helicase RhlE
VTNTPSNTTTPSTSDFASLGLASELLKALTTEGYTTPTPIQAQAIPPVLAGHDLLGIAQTGTGKTAAFALPILQRLAANRIKAPRKGCRALILSPTRELATQIGDSFRAYGKHMGMTVAVIFGGVGHRPQREALMRGIDVLVAAPGRLLDHMDARDADLSQTEIFVLDEADQMLDLGFVKPIQRIVKTLPHRRQNLFFSATMPNEIGALANDLLRNPIKVSVTPVAKTADRVAQRVIHLPHALKRDVLVELCKGENIERGIVFTRTKRGADRVAEFLDKAGVTAAAIHGNKSQGQRERALDNFRKGKVAMLIATDIAARGIDIPAVSHVINFELPDVPEAYVHRIGRTARAGAEGEAIALCAPDERGLLKDIEKLIRQEIPFELRGVDLTGDPNARPARPQPQGRGGQQQGRGGQQQRNHGQHGRSDQRQSSARPQGQRGDGQRGDGQRGDGQRGDGQRADGQRSSPQGGHNTNRAGQAPRSGQGGGQGNGLPRFLQAANGNAGGGNGGGARPQKNWRQRKGNNGSGRG